MGDLRGTAVAVVLTGAGQGERALRLMQRAVEQAGGKVVRSLAVYTLKPNDERLYGTVPNRRTAYDLARAAGAAVLALGAATDVADGALARRLGVASPAGA